ncbi:hypothetical protein [Sphingomonas sp.]|uniref:hypothetical protein n=1 Tax=Sphingomonas sp. TaxID=28214 RepID=UPI002ED952F3
MPSLTTSLIAGVLAFAVVASQNASPEDARQRLESQRRELLAKLQDKNWMQDPTRAALSRRHVERHWKACAENEALAQARDSQRPARLLAESALAACRPWQSALELALEKGAYPYREGPNARPLASRSDMVEAARLAALDAALARIMAWRGIGPAPVVQASTALPRADSRGRIISRPAPIPQRFAPPEPEATPTPSPASASGDEEAVIVVTGRSGECRVRLADRTLSESQLAAKARGWIASGTALKVIRPRGSDYRCMAKIARRLSQHGLRLFDFVEAP